METVRKVIQEFAGVEHRIEYVCEKDGVAYYNDSKGTNPDAAIKGIQAMNRPTLLIGGGYDKQSTYEEWIQAFDGKVRSWFDRRYEREDRKSGKKRRIQRHYHGRQLKRSRTDLPRQGKCRGCGSSFPGLRKLGSV